MCLCRVFFICSIISPWKAKAVWQFEHIQILFKSSGCIYVACLKAVNKFDLSVGRSSYGDNHYKWHPFVSYSHLGLLESTIGSLSSSRHAFQPSLHCCQKWFGILLLAMYIHTSCPPTLSHGVRESYYFFYQLRRCKRFSYCSINWSWRKTASNSGLFTSNPLRLWQAEH
jgi:hypothetical protein